MRSLTHGGAKRGDQGRRGGLARRVRRIQDRLGTDGVDHFLQQRTTTEQLDDRVEFLFAADLQALNFMAQARRGIHADIFTTEADIQLGFGTVGLGPHGAEDDCATQHQTPEHKQLPSVPRNAAKDRGVSRAAELCVRTVVTRPVTRPVLTWHVLLLLDLASDPDLTSDPTPRLTQCCECDFPGSAKQSVFDHLHGGGIPQQVAMKWEYGGCAATRE